MHILFFLAIVQFQGTLIKIQSNPHVRPPLVSDYLPLAIIQNTKMFSLKPLKLEALVNKLLLVSDRDHFLG